VGKTVGWKKKRIRIKGVRRGNESRKREGRRGREEGWEGWELRENCREILKTGTPYLSGKSCVATWFTLLFSFSSNALASSAEKLSGSADLKTFKKNLQKRLRHKVTL
jgi:hypothetical protein